ncbi:MAG: hypothetical protein CM15mP1_2140 [Methanobacteriota archaeon]|nr:MAG: hypothetical protein CM15mP1_2140 [Euryarchaeota archaeon]
MGRFGVLNPVDHRRPFNVKSSIFIVIFHHFLGIGDKCPSFLPPRKFGVARGRIHTCRENPFSLMLMKAFDCSSQSPNPISKNCFPLSLSGAFDHMVFVVLTIEGGFACVHFSGSMEVKQKYLSGLEKVGAVVAKSIARLVIPF